MKTAGATVITVKRIQTITDTNYSLMKLCGGESRQSDVFVYSVNTFEPPVSMPNLFASPTPSVNPSTGMDPLWQFMGEEGIWREYLKPVSNSPPSQTSSLHSL